MSETADFLQQLEELRAAATPGPWTHDPEPVIAHAVMGSDGAVVAGTGLSKQSSADARLIVAAVNSLPRLTAAVRAALAVADDLDSLGSDPDVRRLSAPGAYRSAAGHIRSALPAALTEDAR